MSWKDTVNGALVKATGYQLQRVDAAHRRTGPARERRRRVRSGERLVEAPAFVLSTVRSGSTLLRVILNSHSQVFSPHELHLRDISVKVSDGHPAKALKAIGLDTSALQYLLWDRLLHRELAGSGKAHIVNKTPSDVHIADRIKECWPDARFIFLLRHPAAIARSRHDARGHKDTDERNVEVVLRYARALERARQKYEGLTVRYEDLTADPPAVTQELCRFLGVPWEAEMLDYGRHDHGAFRPGLGDWKAKIKSGQIQPPAPLPPVEQIPEPLRELSAAWGYLPRGDERTEPSLEVS